MIIKLQTIHRRSLPGRGGFSLPSVSSLEESTRIKASLNCSNSTCKMETQCQYSEFNKECRCKAKAFRK